MNKRRRRRRRLREGRRAPLIHNFGRYQTVPPTGFARPRHRLPIVWAVDELRRPHCAPGLLAPRCATRTACHCVAGGADHPTILRAVPSFHEARQRNCHASCRPQPGGCLLDLRSASVGTPGRLRFGQLGLVPPRWRSPPLNRRGAWEGERKVFPFCSALRACAALSRGASGISRAVWA